MAFLRFLPKVACLLICFVFTVAFKQGYPEISQMETKRHEYKHRQLQQDLSKSRKLLSNKLHSVNAEPIKNYNELNATGNVSGGLVKTPRNASTNGNTSSRREFHTEINNSKKKMLVPRGRQHHYSVVQENTDFCKTRQLISAQGISNTNTAVLTKSKSVNNFHHKGEHFTDFFFTPGLLRQYKELLNIRNYILKNINPRKTKLGEVYNSSKRHNYREYKFAVDDKFSAVKKRHETRDVLEKQKIRRKRFIFMDPAENPLMPSLHSIMMGTAQDPNTGKRMEFGGDVMRDMMVNSFLPFLPPGAQPPPGKEPGELIQIMAPVWYFNRLQRTMIPGLRGPPRNLSQMRNQQGYYGETMQGKRRKK